MCRRGAQDGQSISVLYSQLCWEMVFKEWLERGRVAPPFDSSLERLRYQEGLYGCEATLGHRVNFKPGHHETLHRERERVSKWVRTEETLRED